MSTHQYTKHPKYPGLAGMPFVSLTLSYQDRSIEVSALVDSGASVSVLPYDVGLELGLNWEAQKVPAPLWVNVKDAQAWGVVVTGRINPFPQFPLVFAWTRKTSQEVPILLGQTNFFQTFKVLFDGQAGTFTLTRLK